MAAQPGRDRGASRALRRWALPLIAFLLVASASLAVAHRMAVQERVAVLERELAEQAGVIEARIERFGSLIAGAAAHYSEVRHDPAMVTDTELRRYMESVGADERYEDLPHGLSYIARVRSDQIETYEFRRQIGRPRFEVQDGPFRVNQAIIWAQSADVGYHGYRLDIDPERATVLDEALTRNEVLMTPPVAGIADGARVVNLYGPIISRRTREPLGWIGTLVDVGQLVTVPNRSGTMLTITDNNLAVYGASTPGGHLQRSTTLQVMGRSWRITNHSAVPIVHLSAMTTSGLLALLAALAVAGIQRTRHRWVSDVDVVKRDRDRYAAFTETILASVEVGIVACDEHGRIVVVNEAAQRMDGGVALAGGLEAWQDGRVCLDGTGPPLELDPLPLYRALEGEHVIDEELAFDDESGQRVYLMNAQPLRDADGRISGAVCAFGDITDRKAAEAELSRLALHDHLTGLANRRGLNTELDAALRDHAADGPDVTLLFMDLDRFKLVNDTSGHQRGDQMLIEVAEHLQRAVHDGDLAARMGGDEFIVLCRHATTSAEAHALASGIAVAVAPALVVEAPTSIRTGVSIGVVRPDRGADVELVLRHADLAMYDAKRDATNAIRIYEPALDRQAATEFATETALRRAIADAGLDVVFQPIAAVADGSVGAVEALVRWNHGGLVLTPASFLPLAEDAALTADIDLLVLDRACAAAAGSPARPRVHVNIAVLTLERPDLREQVERALGRHDLPADRLCLEINEAILADAGPQITETLRALAATGIALALDGFGTGAASLNHLRRNPIDLVKVDRSVVAGMGTDTADEAVVAAMVRLATSLGLRTVASGVETEAQLAAVTRIGCDLVQGFLIGRPGPLADVVPDLRAATAVS